MTDTNTAAAPAPGSNLPVPSPISDSVVAAYESMIASVPDAGGDGLDGILTQIAQAHDTADLDAPWRSNGLKAWIGQPLVVTGIRKAPSEFESGLPWFLIIDAADVATGETITITTGAAAVVAQLVKAWAMGAFPLRCIPREAKRPTPQGYYPQHLEIRA